MLDQVKAMMQVASGLAEVPRKKAEELARSLTTQGVDMSQIRSVADDIMERSKENAQMVRALISSEIKRQVKQLGLAGKDDLDRISRKMEHLARKSDVEKLEARLARLEKGGTAKKSPAKKATPKKP